MAHVDGIRLTFLDDSANRLGPCYNNTTQAFSERGFPKKEEMKDGSKFIIGWEDILPPGSLLGQGLSLDGCTRCPRNLCKKELQERSRDLCKRQESVHTLLEKLCDKLGKARCGEAKVTVMVEIPVADGVIRMFGLLLRAMFSPKYSIWFQLDWADANGGSRNDEVLTFPFLLRLAEGKTWISPEQDCILLLTSDELALQIAQEGGPDGLRWFNLEYEHPEADPHLFDRQVTAATAMSIERVAATATKNQDLDDLKDLEKRRRKSDWSQVFFFWFNPAEFVGYRCFCLL